MPATGPYRIKSFDPKTGAATLVRNAYFHEWSRDAQPAGYPDRIEWRPYQAGAAGLSAIEDGQADWMFDIVPSRGLEEARLRSPARFHPAVWPYFSYLQLATSQPPFNRRQARLAVDVAVNRTRLIALADAQGQKVPACQLSPPNLFGYAPACRHRQPDLARARRLVAASGTAGMRVTVSGKRPVPAADREIFKTLARIGYRPVWTSADTADVSHMGGATDFPSVANIVDFACLGFCNRYPQLDRLITRAHAAELSTQPGRAGAVWAAVEKLMLRDGSPWVPLDNALAIGFVSSRVGNYQFAPSPGSSPVIDQIWVR